MMANITHYHMIREKVAQIIRKDRKSTTKHKYKAYSRTRKGIKLQGPAAM